MGGERVGRRRGLLGAQATSAPAAGNTRRDFGARESNLVLNFSNLEDVHLYLYETTLITCQAL